MILAVRRRLGAERLDEAEKKRILSHEFEIQQGSRVQQSRTCVEEMKHTKTDEGVHRTGIGDNLYLQCALTRLTVSRW